MIKKIIFIALLFVNTLMVFGQSNNPKNIYGIGVGFSPSREDGIYLGGELDIWPDKKFSPVINLFYARQVTESFRIGSYFEYENAKFDIYSLEDQKALRYNLGINWLGQFPKTPMHIQLGGYTGWGFVNSKIEGWEKPIWGLDLGMIAGPAYETGNIGMALHVQSGFAYYFGKSQPETVLLMLPKFLFKVYYKL